MTYVDPFKRQEELGLEVGTIVKIDPECELYHKYTEFDGKYPIMCFRSGDVVLKLPKDKYPNQDLLIGMQSIILAD